MDARLGISGTRDLKGYDKRAWMPDRDTLGMRDRNIVYNENLTSIQR